jgi:hypothetical protein
MFPGERKGSALARRSAPIAGATGGRLAVQRRKTDFFLLMCCDMQCVQYVPGYFGDIGFLFKKMQIAGLRGLESFCFLENLLYILKIMIIAAILSGFGRGRGSKNRFFRLRRAGAGEIFLVVLPGPVVTDAKERVFSGQSPIVA